MLQYILLSQQEREYLSRSELDAGLLSSHRPSTVSHQHEVHNHHFTNDASPQGWCIFRRKGSDRPHTYWKGNILGIQKGSEGSATAPPGGWGGRKRPGKRRQERGDYWNPPASQRDTSVGRGPGFSILEVRLLPEAAISQYGNCALSTECTRCSSVYIILAFHDLAHRVTTRNNAVIIN